MCDTRKLPTSITICSNTEDETLTLGDEDFESEEILSHIVRQDLEWAELEDIKYFTTGGSSKLYTGKYNNIPVVVKTISPEFESDETVINEMEIELNVLSRLNHPNIVKLYGAGRTTQGNRFLVLERLDGGTMAKIFDDQPDKHGSRRLSLNRTRSAGSKTLPMKDVVNMARGISNALMHCHTSIDGCMVLHRDLKPDNIGFTSEGKLKVLDFGLSRIVETSSPLSDEVYEMTGGTGSLRYMAPEVANSNPYNYKADVYSFGILLWELLSCKKPFVHLNIDAFFEEIVNGGARPPIDPKWPKKLVCLMERCWSADFDKRPSFSEIVVTLEPDILDSKSESVVTDGNRRITRKSSLGVINGNNGVRRTTARRRISLSNYM